MTRRRVGTNAWSQSDTRADVGTGACGGAGNEAVMKGNVVNFPERSTDDDLLREAVRLAALLV